MKVTQKIKPTTLNFISNLFAFLITYSISFFLSPYIVGVLGEEAYGFVSLAQNFTNYIALATVALNSLAGRFISIAVFEGNHEKAQKYYTSVLIANAILTAILIIPSAIVIIELENILSIPVALVSDVKILFATIFGSFFISLFSSLFSVGVFVENKLYLTACVNAISAVLRLTITMVLFLLFPAKIFFMGIVSLTVNLNSLVWQYFFKRKYLPKLKAKRSLFDGNKIKELLKAGSWSLVGQLSGILNSGLDLLIANQFVSSEAMGVLAIATTLPTLIHAVLGSVSSSFTPDLTKDFANGDYNRLMKDLKSSMAMMGMVLIVPLAGLTAFGFDFYKLWQPTQDAMTLQILSVFKILTLTFTARMAALQEIFVVANKLKAQAIATLIQGALHLLLVYILLSTTNLGVFAIVCMGSVIGIARNFLFTFPYAAKCIKQKWSVFFWPSIQAFLSYVIITGLFYAIKEFIYTPTTWLTFIITCIICGALGFVLNMFIITSKESRKAFFDKIKSKLGKNKKSGDENEKS